MRICVVKMCATSKSQKESNTAAPCVRRLAAALTHQSSISLASKRSGPPSRGDDSFRPTAQSLDRDNYTTIFFLISFLYLLSVRLTEQSVAQADGHGLGLDVAVQSSLAELAADTRLLVTAEGKLVVQHVVAVDPDGAGAELVGNLDGGVQVGGVDL